MKSKITQNIVLKILMNLPFWIFLLIFSHHVANEWNFMAKYPEVHFTSRYIISIVWGCAVYYLFYLFLFPKYLVKNQSALFSVFSIAAIVIFSIITKFLLQFTNILLDSPHYQFTIGLYASDIIDFTIISFLLATYAILIRIATDWFIKLSEKQTIENSNLLSELNILKSQLNPHFLFNSLNNIDTLIQNDATKTSHALVMLSDLLRYVVYEAKKETIPIEKELDFINKYIELEQLRLARPEAVGFSSNITDNISLPPMLFQPFIENAFKHSNLNAEDQRIEISLTAENGIIDFYCYNTINENNNITIQNEEVNSGLGLELAEKRLNLLFKTYKIYKKVHAKTYYKVEIHLNLIENSSKA